MNIKLSRFPVFITVIAYVIVAVIPASQAGITVGSAGDKFLQSRGYGIVQISHEARDAFVEAQKQHPPEAHDGNQRENPNYPPNWPHRHTKSHRPFVPQMVK